MGVVDLELAGEGDFEGDAVGGEDLLAGDVEDLEAGVDEGDGGGGGGPVRAGLENALEQAAFEEQAALVLEDEDAPGLERAEEDGGDDDREKEEGEKDDRVQGRSPPAEDARCSDGDFIRRAGAAIAFRAAASALGVLRGVSHPKSGIEPEARP